MAQVGKGIEDIKNFLEAEQIAFLASSLDYLKHVQDVVVGQRLTDTEAVVFTNQLEEIDRKCSEKSVLFRMQMNKRLEESEGQKLGDFAWRRLLSDYGRLAHIYLMAVYVRGLVAEVRCALPIRRDLAQIRLRALRDELSGWTDDRNKFLDALPRHAKELRGGIFRTHYARERYRKELIARADETQSRLAKLFNSVKDMVFQAAKNIEVQIAESSNPLSFVVVLNERGEVEQVWRLLED